MIWLPSSKIAVAFPPAAEATQSGIIVSPGVKGRLRSEIGIVIAVGKQSELGKSKRMKKLVEIYGSPDFPDVGSQVLCKWEDGTIITHPEGVDLEEIKYYGTYASYQAAPIQYEWWHSIMAEKSGETWEATPESVLIRPDEPMERTASGLWLPPTAQVRAPYGVLESVGEFVEDLDVGMRVCFDPHACHPVQRCDDGSLQGLIPAHWSAVLCVIEPEPLVEPPYERYAPLHHACAEQVGFTGEEKTLGIGLGQPPICVRCGLPLVDVSPHRATPGHSPSWNGNYACHLMGVPVPPHKAPEFEHIAAITWTDPLHEVVDSTTRIETTVSHDGHQVTFGMPPGFEGATITVGAPSYDALMRGAIAVAETAERLMQVG